MRILCRLLGCTDQGPDGFRQPCCYRCGADIYGAFIHSGLLYPVFRAVRWRRTLVAGRRCDVCGKRFRVGDYEFVCSAECGEKWMPF